MTTNPASIKQRLLNLARANGEDFQQLLTRYANERFLYRLSISKHSEKFLLKGASLFTLWFGVPHRQTRDVDLLGFGSNQINDLEMIFNDVVIIECEDGLTFDPDSISGEEIKEGEEYQGIRMTFLAKLGNARIYLQTDIGFGDAVNPPPQTFDFRTLLNLPAPRLKVYPKETVVAEKFEAMVKLGIINSRMKDFWDLNLMIAEFEFDGQTLQRAITATFERRKTAMPIRPPIALTEEFSEDPSKRAQWNAFLRRNGFNGDMTLDRIVANLHGFLWPIIEATCNGKQYSSKWNKVDWV